MIYDNSDSALPEADKNALAEGLTESEIAQLSARGLEVNRDELTAEGQKAIKLLLPDFKRPRKHERDEAENTTVLPIDAIPGQSKFTEKEIEALHGLGINISELNSKDREIIMEMLPDHLDRLRDKIRDGAFLKEGEIENALQGKKDDDGKYDDDDDDDDDDLPQAQPDIKLDTGAILEIKPDKTPSVAGDVNNETNSSSQGEHQGWRDALNRYVPDKHHAVTWVDVVSPEDKTAEFRKKSLSC